MLTIVGNLQKIFDYVRGPVSSKILNPELVQTKLKSINLLGNHYVFSLLGNQLGILGSVLDYPQSLASEKKFQRVVQDYRQCKICDYASKCGSTARTAYNCK